MRHPHDLLSPAELSEELKVPVSTLYAWNHTRSGPPPIKVGKHVRYRRVDIEAWLTANTASTT